jgi:hypothetical protein
MSRIGRAQLAQRGRFKIVRSERSSNIETSGSPIDLRQETKPERDMRLRDYRHVAGALIISNEERPVRASTGFAFWALVRGEAGGRQNETQ